MDSRSYAKKRRFGLRSVAAVSLCAACLLLSCGSKAHSKEKNAKTTIQIKGSDTMVNV